MQACMHIVSRDAILLFILMALAYCQYCVATEIEGIHVICAYMRGNIHIHVRIYVCTIVHMHHLQEGVKNIA